MTDIKVPRSFKKPRGLVAQASGKRKDMVIRNLLAEMQDVDVDVLNAVAAHLSQAINAVVLDRHVMGQYASKAFDPNGFSVVKIMRQGGEKALRARLNEVRCVDDLKSLAKAQQIALPAFLRDKQVTLPILRQVIVDGARRRIGDWRAAS